MKITRCQTNHLTNPIGYKTEKPVFSWVVEEAQGTAQAAARLRVAESPDFAAPLLDTGFAAGLDSLAFEANIPLKPRTRYYWQVTVRTNAGEEATSEVSFFETGKRDEPWQAKWITCDSTEPRHPVFSTRLPLAGEVVKARLYICGLGLYEAYLNGERVGDEYLTPYSNAYDDWLQAQTYDVTSALQKGGQLAVLLGNGWYKGRFGFDGSTEDPSCYNPNWKLVAEVHVTYANGATAVFGTEEGWQVTRSQIAFSGLYDGEVLDATLPELPPERATLCHEELAPLTDRLSPPVRVQLEIKPVALIQTPAGETVLDLGQNLAGSFRLRVDAPRGQRVFLQVGEILQQGNFYRDNLRTAKAEYTYISNGEPCALQPHFTFYGYRYVKIEGLPNLKPEDFTALVLHTDMPETGRLSTGQPLVNQLVRNTEWGLRGNFLDVPTDCPQRDERMGWTGDAQVFSPTASFLRDSYAFYQKYLYDTAQEQKHTGGAVPNFVPAARRDGTSAVWGDAACIIPWNLYLFYGDKAILENQFGSMQAWVEYIRRVDGDDHGWRRVFHFGDWLALDNPAGGDDQMKGGTDDGYIASIYYMNSADILAKAARVLGREKEAAEYSALAAHIRWDILAEYFSPNGRCCIGTQTALLLALRHSLTADRPATVAALEQKFLETQGKLRTGFVGSPILCNVLSEEGLDTLAYDLLLNEDYPGWLYEVKLGATTIWERWNSVLPDGSISSTGMNSLNHYAYGSIVEWLYRHAAGLNPVESVPGFRRARIAPAVDRRLGHIDMEYASRAGTYKVGWALEGDRRLTVSVTVPFGCEAELVLPAAPASLYADGNPMFARVEEGVCILAPGSYSVTYEAARPLRKVYSTHSPVWALVENPDVVAALGELGQRLVHMPTSRKGMSLRMASRFGNAGLDEAALDALDKVLAVI